MISVIIPAYNCENSIEKCVNSILDSSFCDFEVIIVNDGSTDKTKDILKRLSKKDNRIRVINKQNNGSASARNMGINEAKGKYIAFVDADDYVDKNYLEDMYDAADKNNLSLVECGFKVVDGKKTLIGDGCTENGAMRVISNKEMLDEFCDNGTYLKSTVLWNKLYKKELFNEITFVEGKSIDDEYVIHKLIYKAKRIGVINKCLYNYCVSNQSQMRSAPSLKRLDSLDALESQMDFFKTNNLRQIEDKIKFRYYRTVIDDLYYIKKYFPNEKRLIKDLTNKRKGWHKSLLCNEKSFSEKIYLGLTRFMPGLAYRIRDGIMGKNKIVNMGKEV